MNIYLIEAETIGMTKEEIANELSVMDEALCAIGGGLLCSDRHDASSHLVRYVRAESGQAVNDLFEASEFAVIRVEFVGTSHGIHRLGLQGGRRHLDFNEDLTDCFIGLDEIATRGAKPGLS